MICVRSHDESPWVRVNHEGVFEYLVLTMEDRTTENIIQLLIQAADFARHAVEQVRYHNAALQRHTEDLVKPSSPQICSEMECAMYMT